MNNITLDQTPPTFKPTELDKRLTFIVYLAAVESDCRDWHSRQLLVERIAAEVDRVRELYPDQQEN